MLESFFNKVAGLNACNFIKKRLRRMCFPVNIAKFLITVLKNIFEWLLLKLQIFLKFSEGSSTCFFMNGLLLK